MPSISNSSPLTLPQLNPKLFLSFDFTIIPYNANDFISRQFKFDHDRGEKVAEEAGQENALRLVGEQAGSYVDIRVCTLSFHLFFSKSYPYPPHPTGGSSIHLPNALTHPSALQSRVQCDHLHPTPILGSQCARRFRLCDSHTSFRSCQLSLSTSSDVPIVFGHNPEHMSNHQFNENAISVLESLPEDREAPY